ncbi:MAG: sigma-70 family RNA polymerase sigma factor [Planctomycetota bacterium]
MSSAELLEQYIERPSELLRDALVERHLPDVADVARALSSRLPSNVDFEDLCNAGYSGLLRCIETFDPSKGRSFLSYMNQRVSCTMIDELRAMDWLPRLMRSRLSQRDHVVENLRQDLRREPTDQEIAAALGVSVQVYRRSFSSPMPSISRGLSSGTEQDADRLEASIVGISYNRRPEPTHPLTSLYHQELIEKIQSLLNETELELVNLHYFEGLSLREVSVRLTLSPARICQIHGRVLLRLKEKLREEGIGV